MDEPLPFYRVEKTSDVGECNTCHQDCPMYTIVYAKNGEPIEIGQVWGDKELAEDICELMNMAYEQGLETEVI